MVKRIFGTDGVRGETNSFPMTAEMALKVATVVGDILKNGGKQRRVVIGKDTRLSGYMLEPALTAGFLSTGMDVALIGPLPTPAIAMLTRAMRADLGVMITASHNPFKDNGIKFFGPDGYKFSEELQSQIEQRVSEDDISSCLTQPEKIGKAYRIDDASGRYIEYVKRTSARDMELRGLKVVVDCANGAAYKIAPKILWELGAEVIPINHHPDGFNINEKCGATGPEDMCQTVVKHKADIGLAFDGDADRVLVADEKGRLVDGDQLIALIAKDWLEKGRLKGNGVVTTIMSNFGLERFLKSQDLKMIRTQVGDRFVVEYMRKNGFNLGGEQSGHIIIGDRATTGDGLLAGLQILSIIKQKDLPASETTQAFTPVPQLLHNVRFRGSVPLDHGDVQKAIQSGQQKLGNEGRIVIRKSGTEPLIRVMAEGENETLIQNIVNDIVGAVEKAQA